MSPDTRPRPRCVAQARRPASVQPPGAAAAATQKVHGKKPDFTREGGSIPVTLDFVVNTGKPACLLPVGASDDGAHSQNEKFDLKNMRNGIKVMASTLHEYASMKQAGA